MKYLSDSIIESLLSEKERLQTLIEHIDSLVALNKGENLTIPKKDNHTRPSREGLNNLIIQAFAGKNNEITRQQITKSVREIYPKTAQYSIVNRLNKLVSIGHLIATKTHYRTFYKLSNGTEA